jgi:hypothetical protein
VGIDVAQGVNLFLDATVQRGHVTGQHDHGCVQYQRSVLDIHGLEFAAGHTLLQQADDVATPGRYDFVIVEPGKFREIAGLCDDQLGNAAQGAAAHVFPPVQKIIAQQIGDAASVGLFPLLQRINQGQKSLVDHCLEQFFLVLVVQIESAFADACTGGDFFKAGTGEAFFREQKHGSVQQFGGAGCLSSIPPFFGIQQVEHLAPTVFFRWSNIKGLDRKVNSPPAAEQTEQKFFAKLVEWRIDRIFGVFVCRWPTVMA